MPDVPVAILHDPGGMKEPAEHLYALIVEHGENDEALAGIPSPLGGTMPAVVMSEGTMAKLLPWGREVARLAGKRVRVVRFDRGDVLEVLEP